MPAAKTPDPPSGPVPPPIPQAGGSLRERSIESAPRGAEEGDVLCCVDTSTLPRGLAAAPSNAAVTENRRGKDLRVRASFRVRFASVDDLVLAYTRNLSRGGMRLRTTRDFPRGSRVEVHIELPDGGAEITVPCEVVDVQHDAANGVYYLGTRFIDPDQETRRRLEWFIINSDPDPGQLGGSPHGYPLQLLVVDDEPRQRAATAAPFVARGDDVRLATDGLDALGQALAKAPDVIVTDVQMPRMDGWQLLRMVRSRPQLARVPVLFLTTLSGETDRLRGYRLGVDDYLGKPPEPRDLLARVDRAAVRSLQLGASTQPQVAGALRGDLSLVGLPSVLAFLELERMTGTLRVGPERNGAIEVCAGRPLRVFLADAEAATQPRERLFALLELRQGRFEFTPGPVLAEGDELGSTASGLLMDHARLRDEAAR